MKMQPFTVKIPQATLDDLQARLARTRWPDEAKDAGWSMGMSLNYLKELVDYWQHQYDWRKHEAKLNQFQQFKADIEGVNIHFIHERGKGENPLPIVLTHGWPDSFYRFHKIIPMLTNPEQYGGKAEDVFDVIVPSMPGFGFSARKTMTSNAVADLWAKLMTELGYKHYAAAGGDIGSGVTQALAAQHPDNVTGIHLTDADYPMPGQEYSPPLSKTEQQFADFIQGWWFAEGAYAMLQNSKPQTLSFALNDSPVGWAAWVLSFVNTGAEDNLVEKAFGSRDELLTNLMIYWVTETAGSSARMYLEDARATYAQADGAKPAARSEVPAAVALFPREAPLPREWAERSLNVQRFNKMPRGGHFAALEEPELFVQDLRDFFGQFRK